ncbi:MAG: VWA domain-containing protein [Planctomycetota bacterium]|nr:VWA domain-containing protein [Planctomycetota bacterium]
MLEFTPLNEYDFLSPDKENTVHFVLKLKTEALKEKLDRKPLNVSLVIDRSGSMSGQKMEYTKKAAQHLIERLQIDDRISLVCYDSEVDVLSPPVSGSQKDVLKEALKKATPRGMTNLSAGWLTGLTQVLKSQSEENLQRVLLLTDGLANEGVTATSALVEIGRNYLRKGIRTTTLGFGNDFNEDLLTKVADESGGNFYFIESPEHAPKVFLEELGELASIIGQNLEVVVKCEAGVTVAQNLSRFPGQQSAGEVSWKVGDLYANDTRLLIFSLSIPKGYGSGYKPVAQIGLRYQSIFEASEKRVEQALAVTFDSAETKVRGPNEEVLREVLTMQLALAREQATAFADKGNFVDAQNVLTTGSSKVKEALAAAPNLSSEDVSFLTGEAKECEEMRDQFVQQNNYDPFARKMMLTQAYQMKKQRGKYKK